MAQLVKFLPRRHKELSSIFYPRPPPVDPDLWSSLSAIVVELSGSRFSERETAHTPDDNLCPPHMATHPVHIAIQEHIHNNNKKLK